MVAGLAAITNYQISMSMKRTRICAHCGKEFLARRGMQKYCCEECKNHANDARKNKRRSFLTAVEPLIDLGKLEYLTFAKAKYRIYDAIQSVLTPGIGWKDFCRSLKARGIETRFNVDQKTGQIVGVSFGQGRYSFAGSKIDAFTSFRHLDNFLNGGLGGGQGVGGSGRSGGQTAETPVSGESETQSFQTPVDTPLDLFAGANGTSDTDDGGTDGGDIVSVAADVIMEIAFQPHYAPAVGGGGGTGSDLKWRDDDREKNKHNTNHIRRSGRR